MLSVRTIHLRAACIISDLALNSGNFLLNNTRLETPKGCYPDHFDH